MAVDMREAGSIGCAYFSADQQILFVMNDVPSASLDMLDALIVHAHPTTILLPFKAPEEVVDMLERRANTTEGPEHFFTLEYVC